MPESRSDIKSLLEVVTRLRRECPWDQKQTHETLSRHLIEESYEVVDAISELGKENSYLELKLELGDLLFSCVNLGRKLGINSETSLLKANDKFERRFRQLEEIVEKKNKSINFLDLPELNEIWISIKNNEVESNKRDDY